MAAINSGLLRRLIFLATMSLCILLVLLFRISNISALTMATLGAPQADKYWVYLSGLTETFDSEGETNNRTTLDFAGKEAGVQIIALHPPKRCKQFNNMLCWPHNSKSEVIETFNYITSSTPEQGELQGFIGFSNGGFFLNKLIQYRELRVPIISIGSAGTIDTAPRPNKIILIVGKKDMFHFRDAKEFSDNLDVNEQVEHQLLIHEGGHEIPLQALTASINSLQ